MKNEFDMGRIDHLIDAILLMKTAQRKTHDDNEAWHKLYRAQMFLVEEIRSTITTAELRHLILGSDGELT